MGDSSGDERFKESGTDVHQQQRGEDGFVAGTHSGQRVTDTHHHERHRQESAVAVAVGQCAGQDGEQVEQRFGDAAYQSGIFAGQSQTAIAHGGD